MKKNNKDYESSVHTIARIVRIKLNNLEYILTSDTANSDFNAFNSLAEVTFKDSAPFFDLIKDIKVLLEAIE